MRNSILAAATFALAAAFSHDAAADARIVPEHPTAFERIHLRMTVDSCTFAPETVHVRAEAGLIKVTQRPNLCLQPGEPLVVDVRLGELPAGDYRVEVFAGDERDAPPVERLAFQVTEPAQIAIFPAPPRPLADYTGVWWNPDESGWGLSLHQGPTHALFGAWFVYGEGGAPEWYTLQGGRWTDSTTWQGTLYRTTGPSFGGPDFDPRLVLVRAAGTVVLDFTQRPGEEGIARFTYTVDGVTASKTITRMSF